VDPIIVNSDMTVIGGHQRLKVLQELNYIEIDCVVIDVPKDKEKALNIALNKISGEWDVPMLKDLLQELDTGDFDMEITGFDVEELESLMTQIHPVDLDEEDEKDEKSKKIVHCPKCGFEFEV
jgi:ParB-like chromosome segregation protein Spo0J